MLCFLSFEVNIKKILSGSERIF
ncbi:MAG: hypothetical protein ACD_2C00061G0001, partial [uncultured bacterium (gcode 4)]